MKINRLPPTMEIRERYIIFSIVSENKYSLENTVKTIWSSILQLFGEVGSSEFNVWIPSNLYNENTNTGIIRCSHNHVQQVRASLALIKSIDNKPLIFKTLGVTGTIRSAKDKFLTVK
ncbi:MAG: ribonuclease P protein component 2 [DPANN group archaeon]|nr:ribonuclease P protein component 2 [DPANN group archaeon]